MTTSFQTVLVETRPVCVGAEFRPVLGTSALQTVICARCIRNRTWVKQVHGTTANVRLNSEVFYCIISEFTIIAFLRLNQRNYSEPINASKFLSIAYYTAFAPKCQYDQCFDFIPVAITVVSFLTRIASHII